jgi:hypothetical protein
MRLIADPALIRMIPRLMGPQLNKMSKFPMIPPRDTPLATVVEEQLRTVKFHMRRYRPDVAGECSSLPLSLSITAWLVCGTRE